jgi:hypothetical protein
MLYKIIEGYSPEQMSDYIQPELDEGWTLHGNLSVRTFIATPLDVRFDVGDRVTIYAQTLIKEESPEELDARVNYFENLLLKPIDQLTPEEQQDREDYLQDLEDEAAEEAAENSEPAS